MSDTPDGKQLSAAISELNTNVIASLELVKKTDKAVKKLKRKSDDYSSDDNETLFTHDSEKDVRSNRNNPHLNRQRVRDRDRSHGRSSHNRESQRRRSR